ncbi:hypothetical protein JXD38_04965 [candidate division WOR-3 bacterium]|nr:hypothetical protein [candidate division WOR-3 bacterium]
MFRSRGLGRNPTFSNNRAVGPLLLCALALGTLLACVALAQVVEGHILLPDSLGPIHPPFHVAMDYAPSSERLYVGSDSGDIVVIDPGSFEKVARIPTGPVGTLCYCPTENKLYVAAPYDTVAVVDCNSRQVVKRLGLGGSIAWVLYNPVVNRVYCGASSAVKVIDCANDSVIGTVPVAGERSCAALDSFHNRLYVGAGVPLKIVDCYSDSVVKSVAQICGVTAMCFNPADNRIYAAANPGGGWPTETLHVFDVKTESVVSHVPMPNLAPEFHPTVTMCVDPVRNRVFTVAYALVAALDCTADTLIWFNGLGGVGIACVPTLDRIYVAHDLVSWMLNGTNGDVVGTTAVDGRAAPPVYLDRLNLLYLLANRGQLAAIDCGPDTTVGQALLDAFVDDSPERVCLDTVNNKLYFLLGGYCGCLGVAGCSAKQVVSYHMLRYPIGMVHDALDDKLYVSSRIDRDGSRKGVSVFDCKSDSLVKVIPAIGMPGGLRWHRDLNKIYADAGDPLGYDYVVVIDCETDSVVRTLARQRQEEWFRLALLSTESDQYWGIYDDGYAVVDCGRDSILIDTLMENWHYPIGVCCSESERKVYVAHGSAELVVLSMETLRPMRRIHLTEPGFAVDAMIHVAAAGKIYVAVMNEPYADTVHVVDTETDSVVSRFAAGHIILAMCDDATGRYVYGTALRIEGPNPPEFSDTLLVIDTERDSIVSGTSLLGLDWVPEWLLPNRRTGRTYAQQGLNGKLLIIRDSVVIGLEESRGANHVPVRSQTVVGRGVPYRAATRSGLFDATGRRAAVLRSGPNDISRLAPGVYFVRGPETEDGRPAAVRKVVLTK